MLDVGCQGFLSSVVIVDQEQQGVEDIPIVCEFLDVFPKDWPGLPLQREIDFTIDIMYGMMPLSKAPYCMAPTKLRELTT